MWHALQSCDEAVLLWIHHAWRHPVLDWLFVALTNSRTFVIPLGLLWIYLLIRGGRRGLGLALVLALTLAATDSCVHLVLKPWIARVRPCFVLPTVQALIGQPHSPSFPSSHAANAFGAAAATAAWCGRRWIWLLLIAAAIGLSRVYVGVHYPSDVLGGALFGAGVGWALAALARPALRLIRRQDAPTVEGAQQKESERVAAGEP